MSKLIVGIDASSTKIALVASGDEMLLARKWDLWQRSDPQVCRYALAVLRRWTKLIAIGFPEAEGVLYLEAPVVGHYGASANIQTTIKQAQVNGAVLAAFGDAGYVLNLVAVNEWKKTLLKGGIGKEVVAAELAKQWPEVATLAGTDQDLIDAGAICLHGLRRA